jgi:hypothetical protein
MKSTTCEAPCVMSIVGDVPVLLPSLVTSEVVTSSVPKNAFIVCYDGIDQHVRMKTFALNILTWIWLVL